MSVKKYRPYLTYKELVALRDVCDASRDSIHKGLAEYFRRFIFDVECDARRANYEASPTMLEKLGERDPTVTSHNKTRAEDTPGTEEYRYLNDQMSPEEEIRYQRVKMGLNPITGEPA